MGVTDLAFACEANTLLKDGVSADDIQDPVVLLGRALQNLMKTRSASHRND